MVPDPTTGPVVTADSVVAYSKPLMPVGVYAFRFAWGMPQGDYTNLSPATTVTADGTHSVALQLPVPPTGVNGFVVTTDNGYGGTNLAVVEYGSAYPPNPPPLFHPGLLTAATFANNHAWFLTMKIGGDPTITVTGSRGGNAALASLLTVLDTKGILHDMSTP